MTATLIQNCTLFDPRAGTLTSRGSVLIADDKITEVSDQTIAPKGAEVIDLGGTDRAARPDRLPRARQRGACQLRPGREPRAAGVVHRGRRVQIMRGMLMRGFTTVRDAGGADRGLRDAVEQGLFTGPRLFISGRAISQTGGHGDFRERIDSPAALRLRAFRQRHRPRRRRRARGAAGGARRNPSRRQPDQDHGVAAASPRPPTRSTSCSIRAPSWTRSSTRRERADTYVMAHAYTPAAISRADRGRGAHDRARQPDRRGDGRADGRARRLPRADPGDVQGAGDPWRHAGLPAGHAGQAVEHRGGRHALAPPWPTRPA